MCSLFTCIAATNAEDLVPNKNIFQDYDNYIAINYGQSVLQDTSSMSGIGLSGEVLFDNNIWLNASVMALLSYDLTNSNTGFNDVLQNKAGSSFTLRGGYAFNPVRDYNVIPYLGFNYTNLLVAYNYDSIQQFIFENPSYNFAIGVINEFNAIDKTLKLRLDTSLMTTHHFAVLPNSTAQDSELGHVNFYNYVFNVTPEIQYNINSRLMLSGYYSFGTIFGGSGSAPNVFFPDINTYSSDVINNSGIFNSVGVKFGVLF